MKTLLIALPGLRVTPEDFETQGFVAKAKRFADMTAPAFGPYDYLEPDFADTLRRQAILPARAAGYGRIVLLALSSGALGALRYVARHDDIDGLIFLAPFFANPGTIAEVETAGGFSAWTPGPLSASDIERPGLLWLKSHAAAHARPWLHLAFGTEDRFAAGAKLLAGILPELCATTCPGGHDWPTWQRLWDIMLTKNLLGSPQ